MSPNEFTLWLLIVFAIALFILLLIVLHERANTRSDLNEILLRNGSEFEDE